MASGCPVKELCEETTCPICLEYFTDPVILDCGHNFCLACLTQHRRGFGMAAACPQCREKDLRRSVRPNRQLANIVELVKKLQKGEGPEGKGRICEKHQEPLKLYCEDDQTPICVVCNRSKEHRSHTVLPVEEATQEHKASCSEAGAQSMAAQYLKMDLPTLLEHCQQKGLRSEGLGLEDLRILLIQHSSQPELESAKVKAKKNQCQQLEHDTQEGCNPKKMEPFHAPEKTREEQVTAQGRGQNHKWDLLQPRKKQPDGNIPKSFVPFSPGGNPIAFLSNFERAAQKQRVAVEEYMVYLPPLLRGELAEFYHSLSERESVPYHAFKAAVSKNFHLEVGGREEAHSKREKRSPSIEHKSCPKLTKSTKSTCKPVYLVTPFFEVGKEETTGLRETVMVKGKRVVAVLSTASTISVVRADLVSPSDLIPGETFLIRFTMVAGICTVPVARLPFGWRGQTSLLKVGVVEGLKVAMIVGGDVLFRDPRDFDITLDRWAEWLVTDPDEGSEPKSKSEAEQISSGRPVPKAGTFMDSRKGGALGDTTKKAQPSAEGDGPSSSSSEEGNLTWENYGIMQGSRLLEELARRMHKLQMEKAGSA